MFLVEAPVRDLMIHQDFNDFFNWTVTYHRASDFPHPYARIYPSDTTDNGSAWHTPLDLTYPRGNGNPGPWEETLKGNFAETL